MFLATVRKLSVADRADWPAVLRGMADVTGADVDPETLLAAIRRYGGTATVATSDVGDIQRLLDATDDTDARTSASTPLL